ncbi:uncharacterized protein N7482_005804 [Penicillium canariense]|uniref:NAD(P)-binding domain-containing protein n=1 Tax=Penicillium canariense TaxID=189055 RepID=A0A9W9I596_9EURO|nr:uncharacterized protein N7482_005804 [Penicillium canariense]KAJ5167023.1 hypothetical protein N7482_005804 [Penicillium canariense]
MSSNILITGAGGYIGGSIAAHLLAKTNGLIQKDQVIAAVRSKEQADAVSKLGIRVLQLDLSNEKDVTESVLHHNISIVIHTASVDPSIVLPLVNALGKQKQVNGGETHFIYTSGLSAFYEKTGWPVGSFKDTDPVFDTEKRIADSFLLRKTDVAVIEHAEAQGVTSFIVVPSLVYGKGSGEWNKLSVVLPLYVKASISAKAVYKFPENPRVSGVHISDLTALYGLIVEHILRGETVPSGREGYYFALAHDMFLGEVGDHLARALCDRGLISDSKTHNYSDPEAAAESLGVPAPFVQMLWDSGPDIIAELPHSIGWKPEWNKERFLQDVDDEVQAVVDLGKAKSSLVDSLLKSAMG